MLTGNNRNRFEVTFTNLAAGTTYTFTVDFLDGGGNVLGSSVANGCPFTTTAPLYVCVAATGITQTSAVIGGSTNNALVTEARFFVSPAGGTAPADTTFTPNANNGNRDFSSTVTGLTAGTSYTFVVQFLDANGNILGSSSNVAPNNCPFTTLAIPPTYVCIAATNVGQTTATLNGRTTNASVTQATFVLTPAAGAPQTDTSVTVNGVDRDFSVNVAGLTPNTGYTFVVQFKDLNGNVVGTSSSLAPNNCPFTTLVGCAGDRGGQVREW